MFSRSSRAGQLALLSSEHSAPFRLSPEGPSRSSGLAHSCLTQVTCRGSAGELCMCCHPQKHVSQWLCSLLQPSTLKTGKSNCPPTIPALHFAPVPAGTLLTLPSGESQASMCNLLPRINITKSSKTCTKYPHILPSAMQVFNSCLRAPPHTTSSSHTLHRCLLFFRLIHIPTHE